MSFHSRDGRSSHLTTTLSMYFSTERKHDARDTRQKAYRMEKADEKEDGDATLQ